MSENELTPLRRRSDDELKAAIAAAAWHALAGYAKKAGDREQLHGGEEIAIALSVAGEVGGHWFEHDLDGVLSIGRDQTSADSKGPKPAHLAAWLLEQLPKRKRLQVAETLLAHYREHRALPDVSPEGLSAAETLLAQLRNEKTITKKGNVRFAPAKPSEKRKAA